MCGGGSGGGGCGGGRGEDLKTRTPHNDVGKKMNFPTFDSQINPSKSSCSSSTLRRLPQRLPSSVSESRVTRSDTGGQGKLLQRRSMRSSREGHPLGSILETVSIRYMRLIVPNGMFFFLRRFYYILRST